MVQDFADLPSIITVQAPQLVVSHPICVPVMLKFSRKKCASKRRGSTSAECCFPFTVKVIGTVTVWSISILPSLESV